MEKRSLDFCDVCSKHFSGIECYLQHIYSDKHKKKCNLPRITNDTIEAHVTSTSSLENPALAMANKYYCGVCKKNLTGPEPFDAHIKGAPHAKQVKKLKLMEGYQSQTVVDVMANNSKTNSAVFTNLFSHFCEICNVTLTGEIPATQHYNGATHKKKEAKNNIMKRLEAGKLSLNTDSGSDSDDNENVDKSMNANEKSEEELKEELKDVIFCPIDKDPLEMYKTIRWD